RDPDERELDAGLPHALPRDAVLEVRDVDPAGGGGDVARQGAQREEVVAGEVAADEDGDERQPRERGDDPNPELPPHLLVTLCATQLFGCYQTRRPRKRIRSEIGKCPGLQAAAPVAPVAALTSPRRGRRARRST